ncbi:MAG: PAS domain S-box protein [Myxococcota bacterium]|nr:PAS domain S-box protein [Myxococcota bacterium]
MSIQAVPSLLAFIAAVFLGAFVFFRNPKSLVNILYMTTVILAGWYAFTEFGYCISKNFDQARFWWEIDIFGPLSLLSLLYFNLALFDQSHIFKRKIFHFILIPPALAVVLTMITTDLVHGPPIEQSWGWLVGIYRLDTVAGNLTYVWVAIMWLSNIFIAVRYYFRTTDSRKKGQAHISIFAILSAFSIFIIDLLRSTILPNFNFPTPFSLALICSFTLYAYAIWKYDMFALTPITAAENIIATMSDTLLLVAPNGKIISANTSAHQMLGYSKYEIEQLPVEAVLGENVERPSWMTSAGHDADSATKSNRIKYVETNFRTKDSREIPISLAGSALFDNMQKPLGFVLIGRDISEKQKAEAELRQHRDHLEELVAQRTRELEQEMVEKLQITDTVHRQRHALDTSQEQLRLLGERLAEVKEEESARIARDLHDELGQLLTSLKIDASLLARHLKQGAVVGPDAATRAETIEEVAARSIGAVQRITKELRPSMLDGIGLVPTIEWMVSEFVTRTEIEVAFDGQIQSTDLDRSLATAVYRIIQESLTNVARHAKATKVRIALSEQEGVIFAVIEDNGVGITEHQVANPESVGLLGMTERARPFGGAVTVQGESGKGTTVSLRMPTATDLPTNPSK